MYSDEELMGLIRTPGVEAVVMVRGVYRVCYDGRVLSEEEVVSMAAKFFKDTKHEVRIM